MEETVSIEFGQSVPQQVVSLSDEEFLQAIHWKSKPSGDLMKGAQTGDLSRFIKGLSSRLKETAKQKKQGKHAADMLWASLWSEETDEETCRTSDLIKLIKSIRESSAKNKKKSKDGKQKKTPELSWDEVSRLLRGWLSQVTTSEPLRPYELLLLTEVLENVGYRLAPAALVSVWRQCLFAAASLCFNLEETDFSETSEDQVILVSGELPWRLSFLFSDISGAKNFRQLGQQNLRDCFFDRTDNDGTPHADYLPRIDFWLATLTRSLFIGQVWKKPVWDQEALERFQWSVEKLVAACDVSGKIALCPTHSVEHLGLLAFAAYFAELPGRSAERLYLKSLFVDEKKRPSFLIQAEDESSCQSDWSALALMRNYWSDAANLVLVSWNGALPELSLSAMGKTLFGGRWDFSLIADGKEITGDGEWSCVCWSSDADADYLELQMDLESGYRLERQILLPRNQHFVFLSDIVTGTEAANLEYRSMIPVTSGIASSLDGETHEMVLKTKGLSARVFPIGLSQERDFFQPGSLTLNDESQLVLQQQVSKSTGLYAPLIIDWEPGLKRKPADWTSLTVSEGGNISARDEASGHRLRIGKHQLLVYRSLKKGAQGRAVLGHHTNYESVIGRFDTDGELIPLLFVE
ncbi:hypothetical protein [uncultured Gimesia sp.]|uniref:hypothetical protein n=1 Tax=uncultured Gimesia sp. TaxID=1678688 RepID=UPI0030DA0F4C|tara:strand:- start:248602 stop:250509 length:1908 start_codon:yes stop_codon:yes gene_type:complete